MTKIDASMKLEAAGAVMDIHERWALTGNFELLARLHNLIVRPLLNEVKRALDEIGADNEPELHLSYLWEELRANNCAVSFNQQVRTVVPLQMNVAGGDSRLMALLDMERERTVVDITEEILLLDDEWATADYRPYAQMLRVAEASLKQVLEKTCEWLEQAHTGKTALDDYAVKSAELFVDSGKEVLVDVLDWLNRNLHIDPGEDYVEVAEAAWREAHKYDPPRRDNRPYESGRIDVVGSM